MPILASSIPPEATREVDDLAALITFYSLFLLGIGLALHKRTSYVAHAATAYILLPAATSVMLLPLVGPNVSAFQQGCTGTLQISALAALPAYDIWRTKNSRLQGNNGQLVQDAHYLNTRTRLPDRRATSANLYSDSTASDVFKLASGHLLVFLSTLLLRSGVQIAVSYSSATTLSHLLAFLATLFPTILFTLLAAREGDTVLVISYIAAVEIVALTAGFAALLLRSSAHKYTGSRSWDYSKSSLLLSNLGAITAALSTRANAYFINVAGIGLLTLWIVLLVCGWWKPPQLF